MKKILLEINSQEVCMYISGLKQLLNSMMNFFRGKTIIIAY